MSLDKVTRWCLVYRFTRWHARPFLHVYHAINHKIAQLSVSQ